MAFKIEIINIENNTDNIILTNNLTIEDVKVKYNWLLNASVKNCIVGEDINGLVWYSGEWVCGEWINGTWYSGIWHDGIWYNGKWYSYLIDKSMIISNRFVILNNNKIYSEFRSGQWREGDFYNGTFGYDRDIYTNISEYDILNKTFDSAYWFNGKFHDGLIKNSVWYNGIFYNGDIENSYWIDGKFYNGTFNHHIWYNGFWYGGDFVEGVWANGEFDQISQSIKSRFGTANLDDTRTYWNNGNFYKGEFHSGLNLDSSGNTLPSLDSSKTQWYNGNFINGDWYGGHFRNGNWKNGNWYSGVFNTDTGSTYSDTCNWYDGKWYNGLWINGVFHNGHFYDGMWLNGNIIGGYISTNIEEGSLLPPSPESAPVLPIVITYSPSNIQSESVTLNGRVTNNGGAPILDRGFCWSINPNPTTGNTYDNYYIRDGGTTGNINISIGDLSQLTLYYCRAFARNVTGITYGNEITFTTSQSSELPAVSTLLANNITTYSFDGVGYISYSLYPLTDYGICWTTGTTQQTPTKYISNDPPWQGAIILTPGSIGQFSISGETTGNTLYWYRAFATNSEDTGYGSIKNFTTKDYIDKNLPTVVTTSVIDIIDVSAVVHANVTDNGNDRIISVGVCWSTSIDPITGITISGVSGYTVLSGRDGIFNSTITELLPTTTYYTRAYAINSLGTSYGDNLTLVTTILRAPPTVEMIECTAL